MKKIFNFIFAIAIALAGVAGGANLAYADEGEEDTTPRRFLGISPTALVITLRSGEVIEGDSSDCAENTSNGCVIEVKNLGTETFRYRVYATPYAVSGENYDVSFAESESTSYTQIARWITFKDASGNYADEVFYEITPGETQYVYYRVSVPEDIPGGAQYAAIWAQAVNDDTNSGVQAIAQAGAVVYGRSIGTTKQTAEIYDMDFTRFTFGGSLTAQATIKNTGNTDFSVNYSYTARTIFGKELYSENRSMVTYPGTEYHIATEWEKTPIIGLFQVEYKISAASTTEVQRHLVLIMPIFAIVLLILLLTIIIVWIIIIIRKRKERKARTLV